MQSDLMVMMVGYGMGSGVFLAYHGILEILKARRGQKLRRVILRRLELEPQASF